jgi:hypothetical protein
MSKGVLLFAQNNPEIDYVQMAIFAAERINKFLNVPVTLATDNRDYIERTYPDKINVFENIIDVDSAFTQKKQFYDGALTSKVLPWKNFTRADAFDISPYDETLIMDVDYILNSDNLNKVWDSAYDLAIYKTGYDLAQWRDTSSFEYVNQYTIPFYWATVFYFKKTAVAKSFFKIIQHIRHNWNYYRLLYAITTPAFRNDYAFSIAIHLLTGHTGTTSIASLPGKLYYTRDRDILESYTDSSMTLLVEKQGCIGEYTLIKPNNLDVHVMNKYSLARCINE